MKLSSFQSPHVRTHVGVFFCRNMNIPKEKLITDDLVEQIIREAPALIKANLTMNLPGIAKHFGISRVTLWRLRKKYEELDKSIDEAIAERDLDRGDAIESKFIKRLISGDATEAGYIFYLCNHFPEKYKNQKIMINNNPAFNNQPIIAGSLNQIVSVLEKATDDQLDEIISRARTPSQN